MLVKVLKRERYMGRRLEPDTIIDLPESTVKALIALPYGPIVETLDRKYSVNVGESTLATNAGELGSENVMIRNEDF